jgi:hypothetical protein
VQFLESSDDGSLLGIFQGSEGLWDVLQGHIRVGSGGVRSGEARGYASELVHAVKITTANPKEE